MSLSFHVRADVVAAPRLSLAQGCCGMCVMGTWCLSFPSWGCRAGRAHGDVG